MQVCSMQDFVPRLQYRARAGTRRLITGTVSSLYRYAVFCCGSLLKSAGTPFACEEILTKTGRNSAWPVSYGAFSRRNSPFGQSSRKKASGLPTLGCRRTKDYFLSACRLPIVFPRVCARPSLNCTWWRSLLFSILLFWYTTAPGLCGARSFWTQR